MRLTADLVRNAPCYYNTLKERELSLRSYKIPAIENLGVTKDTFEVIDLSNNELIKIDNFPLFKKLHTLLLMNNQINSIEDNINKVLPNLNTLILSNNKIKYMNDLNSICQIKTLERLSLLNNPVTKEEHYRLYLIARLPKLKILDFQKIKDKERKVAESLYAETQQKRHIDNNDEQKYAKKKKVAHREPTEEEKAKIMQMIQSATSLKEIDKLELMLSGHAPISL